MIHSGLSHLYRLMQEPGLPEATLAQIVASLEPWDKELENACFRNIVRVYYQQSRLNLKNPQVAKQWLSGYSQYRMLTNNLLSIYDLWIPAWFFKPNITCGKLADQSRLLLKQTGQPYARFSAGLPPVAAWRMPTLPSRKELLMQRLSPNSLGESAAKVWSVRLLSEWLYKCEGETRLSSIRLLAACKLYERRHGRLPTDLPALVPEILKEIPRDPFDGAPFRYSQSRRLLYSVGCNCIDDGGTGMPYPAWNIYTPELVMPIDLPAPPAILPVPPDAYRHHGNPFL
jgi:hypothetical protein